jgi:hypothetical protein
MLTFHGILSGGLLPELLGEPDENSFGTSPIRKVLTLCRTSLTTFYFLLFTFYFLLSVASLR